MLLLYGILDEYFIFHVSNMVCHVFNIIAILREEASEVKESFFRKQTYCSLSYLSQWKIQSLSAVVERRKIVEAFIRILDQFLSAVDQSSTRLMKSVFDRSIDYRFVILSPTSVHSERNVFTKAVNQKFLKNVSRLLHIIAIPLHSNTSLQSLELK